VASGLALGNPEKLTALADERLYEAKRLGKNRVQG
jgi:PleD family two-component response regulator